MSARHVCADLAPLPDAIRALVTSCVVLATAGARWFFGLLLDAGVSMLAIAAGNAGYVLFGIATLSFTLFAPSIRCA